jgi:DNA mismatch endonuclease (patch repair protein)
MDTFTPRMRQEVMRRVRAKDTKPEMTVRRLAHRLGFRFRLHRRDLPGNPDLVFVSLGKIIFVHGCFWHGHACRSGRNRPSSNRAYWIPKLDRNVARDQKNRGRLRRLGWRVMVVWECQLANIERLEKRIERFLGEPNAVC